MAPGTFSRIAVPVITNEVIAVWEKGRTIIGEDPNEWRMDEAGYRIQFRAFGNRESDFGWERHHVIPRSKGGSDDISNLIPLYWRENVRRGDRGL